MGSHTTTADLARAAIDQLEPFSERIERGRLRQQTVWRGDDEVELPILLHGCANPPTTRRSQVVLKCW